MKYSDQDRLDWLADNQIVEGFANLQLDLHDYASKAFYESGETMPEVESYRIALRQLIDDAMRSEVEE